MIGIYINDSDYPFTDWIMEWYKDMETRNSPTLDAFIGKRVAVIRTGVGNPTIIGTTIISGVQKIKNWDEWDALSANHQVPESSKYCWNEGTNVKYGYFLEYPQRCHATPLDDVLIKKHGRVYCEIKEV